MPHDAGHIDCRAIDRWEISVGGVKHQSQLGASQDDRVDAVALRMCARRRSAARCFSVDNPDHRPLRSSFIAKSSAASTWMAVVSNIGRSLSSGPINIQISVQPRMIPSAPRWRDCAMTDRQSALDCGRNTPRQSTSARPARPAPWV